MAIEPTYPGVSIDETPSNVRAIIGVATSVAGFVGYAPSGPENKAVQIDSVADFAAKFAGVGSANDLVTAINQFFANGGQRAVAVRVPDPDGEEATSPAGLIGSREKGTGIYALDMIDDVNLLVVPNQTHHDIHAEMLSYAQDRRAFAILDLPAEIATTAQAKDWLATLPPTGRSHAATYYPRIRYPGSGGASEGRYQSNSGAVAGVIARTDQILGVWHAPAGMYARIVGAVGVETALPEKQIREFAQSGLNPIRVMPGSETAIWGGRTLADADGNVEWKYISVRRTALFIEESLYRSLKWTVFEPNGEVLWLAIRLSVVAFMHSLFKQGAFKGASPRDAYFVRCDGETTTAADIASGIVNVEIGFAPLRPAEFVVITLKVIAGPVDGSPA